MTDWPDYCFKAPPPAAIIVDLADTIRRKSLGVARGALIPCDLDSVCTAGGFTTQWSQAQSEDQSPQARLIPKEDDGFRIIITLAKGFTRASLSSDQELRQTCRFLIAREVGRSFFFDRTAHPPAKLATASAAEEAFCDAFAADLLVSPSVFNKYTATPGSILQLHRNYDVSVEVSAWVATRRWQDVCIAGLLATDTSAGWTGGLKVQWCVGPYSIPIGERFRSKAVERSCDGGLAHGVEHIDAGSLHGEFDIQATKLADRNLVVAVIQPVHRPAQSGS